MKREDVLLRGARRFRRGFREEAIMNGRIDRELLAREPIRALRLNSVPLGEVQRASELLGRIEELRLRTHHDLSAIVRAVGAGRIRRLTIVGNTGQRHVRALAPELTALRSLGLRSDTLDAAALTSLLGALPPLEELDLMGSWEAELADPLLAWAHAPSLARLSMDEVTLGVVIGLDGLRSLELNQAYAAFLPALRGTRVAAQLERLRVFIIRGDESFARLTPGSFPRLRELSLGGVWLRGRAIEGLLAAAPRLGRLKVVPADSRAQELLAEHFPSY
jgi:hypothetical protein